MSDRKHVSDQDLLALRIENDFTYHAPTEDQRRQYEILRAEAKALAHQINKQCPSGREKSMALSKLEESIMWANAAIARAGKGERG